MAGGTGRVRDLLMTSPVIFGTASVAVAIHVLPASARLTRAMRTPADAANVAKFRICPFPAPDGKTKHRKPGVSIGGRAAGPVNPAVGSVPPRQSASIAPTSASATIVPLTLASP